MKEDQSHPHRFAERNELLQFRVFPDDKRRFTPQQDPATIVRFPSWAIIAIRESPYPCSNDSFLVNDEAVIYNDEFFIVLRNERPIFWEQIPVGLIIEFVRLASENHEQSVGA